MPNPRLPLYAGLIAATTLSFPAFGQEIASCPLPTDNLPPPVFSADPGVVLTADEVSLDKEGLSKLLGAVTLRQGDKEFTAEALDYDDTERQIFVRTDSIFRNRQLVIHSKEARFDLDAESGSFSDTEFTLPVRAARGDSSEITLSRDGTAGLSQVRYTTCAANSDAWYLEAANIKLDHEEGLGTAKHARLRFFGVPILYAPWFQFPIDDRRRTGLLAPTIGNSDRTGWDLQQPIYVNLAPNYDATLTPRYMSERGLQLTTAGRYLLPRAEGTLAYEYLGDDKETRERRDYFSLEHRSLINRRLALDVSYGEVSDPAYFEDLGGKIDLSSITHLERSARFTYQAPTAYSIQALVQDYQTIASSLVGVDDPYKRLPQIRFDALTRQAVWDTRLGFLGEYVNFARDNSVEGQRVDLHPFLRMEKDQVSWFANSQLDYRYTTYQLSNVPAGQASTLDRAVPLFSAEYGLRFDRITDSGAIQLLEPRLFYLYVPYEDQSQLPVFDSGEPDFDFTQLFARNRFSGEDRLSDANHLTAALTGRHLDPTTGAVKAAFSVGQLFRFTAPRVTLPGEPAPDSGATDFIAGVEYYLDSRWGARLSTQWSPEDAEFSRSSIALRYRDDRRRAEVAYRHRRDLLEQADVTLMTPIYGRYSFAGRWLYSLSDRQPLDLYAGISYETCCWSVMTSYRRYVTATNGEFNSGVSLQLELKGLARLGSGLENLFRNDEVY